VVIFELFRAVKLCLLENKGKKLLDRTHGAYPPACDTSQEERHDDSKHCRKEEDVDHSRGDEGNESKQGIEMEKDLHPFDIILSGKASHKEKIEKKSKEEKLSEDPDGLYSPVLFRSFFFQCSISPGRSFLGLFLWQFGGIGALRV